MKQEETRATWLQARPYGKNVFVDLVHFTLKYKNDISCANKDTWRPLRYTNMIAKGLVSQGTANCPEGHCSDILGCSECCNLPAAERCVQHVLVQKLPSLPPNSVITRAGPDTRIPPQVSLLPLSLLYCIRYNLNTLPPGDGQARDEQG